MKPLFKRVAPPVLLLLALSGCTILPKPNQVVTYQLPRVTDVEPARAKASSETPESLRVQPFKSTRELASDRVIIVQPDGRLTAWQGIRWNDAIPALLADRLVEAFILDGRIPHGAVDTHSPHAALELTGHLRAFQLEYDAQGALVVSLQADMRLEEGAQGKIVKSKRFTITLAVPGKDEAQVVKVFGEALNQFAKQAVKWALG